MPTKKKSRKAETDSSRTSTNEDEALSKDLTKYVTTRQAADKMGVVTDHINHLLAKGKIKGIKLGYSWLVYLPSLEAYQQNKAPGGRPRSRAPQVEETR